MKIFIKMFINKIEDKFSIVCFVIIKFHKENEWLTFDDSKLHTAFNNSTEDRYILLIDMKRPDFIKIGCSLREDNLDELINEFINENI